jgi:hypothetical protein
LFGVGVTGRKYKEFYSSDEFCNSVKQRIAKTVLKTLQPIKSEYSDDADSD